MIGIKFNSVMTSQILASALSSLVRCQSGNGLLSRRSFVLLPVRTDAGRVSFVTSLLLLGGCVNSPPLLKSEYCGVN